MKPDGDFLSVRRENAGMLLGICAGSELRNENLERLNFYKVIAGCLIPQ